MNIASDACVGLVVLTLLDAGSSYFKCDRIRISNQTGLAGCFLPTALRLLGEITKEY